MAEEHKAGKEEPGGDRPPPSSNMRLMFVMGHFGLEIIAEQEASKFGWDVPAYIETAMILICYFAWNMKKSQPLYNLLLLTIPIIGGQKLHEMFDDLAEG